MIKTKRKILTRVLFFNIEKGTSIIFETNFGVEYRTNNKK